MGKREGWSVRKSQEGLFYGDFDKRLKLRPKDLHGFYVSGVCGVILLAGDDLGHAFNFENVADGVEAFSIGNGQ